MVEDVAAENGKNKVEDLCAISEGSEKLVAMTGWRRICFYS